LGSQHENFNKHGGEAIPASWTLAVEGRPAAPEKPEGPEEDDDAICLVRRMMMMMVIRRPDSAWEGERMQGDVDLARTFLRGCPITEFAG
jgi:hypothetical protein